MIKLICSPIVWQCVAEQISICDNHQNNGHYSTTINNSDRLLEKFLKIMLLLHGKIRTLDERFRQVLLHITSEHKFFNPVRGRFRGYVDHLANSWKAVGDSAINNDSDFDSDSSDDSIRSWARRRAESDTKKKRELTQKFLNLIAKVKRKI